MRDHAGGSTRGFARICAVSALALILAGITACDRPASTDVPPPSPMTPTENVESITSAPAIKRPAGDRPAVSPESTARLSKKLAWDLSALDERGYDPGEELTFTVGLEPALGPQDSGISGIQFEINYPVESLDLLEIVPGSILGPDPLVVNQFDQVTGKALFALARRGDTMVPVEPGQVALIVMRALPESLSGQDVIILLDRIKVTGGDFQTISQESIVWRLSGPD